MFDCVIFFLILYVIFWDAKILFWTVVALCCYCELLTN
ncbi:hypothetical protein A1OE_660 [Candidatus Endolissoclinum faulkneri L2]|uniref:Uncharacterized protein n=1 Tax=Candidatus Endolissoclinum faulkneri L2 TaxID=1193729 RepID=K7Z4A5_9PROT|nr:hypothetical protein A1OE_660 [Candidatus Endolissoclinum faulkneri L2]